jgi:acetyltransferase-like isoleucine patch superfamily enzyme
VTANRGAGGRRNLIERAVERLGKHRSFKLDPHLTPFDLAQMSCQMMGWFLRGFLARLRFGRSAGLVMIGRGVSIRYPRYLRVGKNFIVEDYAEILALSRQGIICGDNVTIGAYATIKPTNYYGRNLGEGLHIGDNTNIGRYSYVGCSGLITIGRNVMVSPRVSLYAENHNFQDTNRAMRDQGVTRAPIVIEDDCWIASGAIILAGITIGHGSVVAAGSIVTHDVPSFSIVAGSPARVIGSRIEAQRDEKNQNSLSTQQ